MRYTLEHAYRNTDIHQHLVTLHNLVCAMGAKLVLELGVRGGESTVALLEAVGETGGKLVSVDMGGCEGTLEMLRNYGIANRLEFHKSDDIEFGTKVWDRSKLFDLVFIDTSHEYQHTKREIEVFEPITRPGGVMVFHDTVSYQDGVMRPLQEFLAIHKNYTFEHHPNCHGLGIIRKPA